MTIFGREPIAWIGIIAAVAIAVIQTLLGQGVISDVAAGKAIDLTTALGQVLTIIVPLVAALAGRTQVTPTVAPKLLQGTIVTVQTPPGQPDTKTTL